MRNREELRRGHIFYLLVFMKKIDVKWLNRKSNKMETSYSYFKHSLTKGNYHECLNKLKLVGYGNSTAYMAWAWTIPGLYEEVIQDSTTLANCYQALEFYLQPLEFSSTLGLPAAISKDEVAKLRTLATAWVDGGMKMDDNTLNESMKETIFNKSVNFDVACRSLAFHVDTEWRRVMWADIAAREHMNNKTVVDHVTEVVKAQNTLAKQDVIAKICIHNMLTGCGPHTLSCPICI